MGDSYSQPPADGHAKTLDRKMEFLKTGNNDENCTIYSTRPLLYSS